MASFWGAGSKGGFPVLGGGRVREGVGQGRLAGRGAGVWV